MFPAVVESSGIRIALHDLGGPDNEDADVLLFSHATGFHGNVWLPMAAHLADRFHCVALDHRGHGLSKLHEGANELAWSAMADDVLVVLREIVPRGTRVHGVGHSMGGAVLVLAAARRPGVFRSLWLYEPVVVPPGGLTSADGPNPMAEGAARRRVRFDSVSQALENFAAKAPLNQLDPAALRAYVEGGFEQQPDGTLTLRCRPETEAEVFRQALRSGSWDALKDIDLPVAIVLGRVEAFGPAAFARQVAEALRKGTLIERPALGHFGPLQDPAAMARDVSDWVDSHSG